MAFVDQAEELPADSTITGQGGRMEVTTRLDAATRALADVAPRGFAVVTLDGRFTYWNRQAELTLGWTASQVLGRSDPTVMSEEDHRQTLAILQRVAAGEPGPTGVALPRRAADGSVVTVVIDAYVPLGDPVTEIGLWFGTPTQGDGLGAWRETLARELVQALSAEDVAAIVSIGLDQLLGPASWAVVYTPLAGIELLPRLTVGERGGAPVLPLEPADATPAWALALQGRPAGGALDGEPCLFVPMGPPDHPWVLAAGVPTERHRDVSLHAGLRALAHETWLAVQRADLVTDLEGQLEILTAITAVAGAAGVDLAELTGRLGRLAQVLLDAQRVGLYLVEEDRSLAAAFAPAPDQPGLEVGRRAVAQRSEVATLNPDESWVDPPWRTEDGVTDVVTVPLRVGGSSVGALVLARLGDVEPFSGQTRQVAAALAQQAAFAVGHARLFANEQATVSRLQELDQLKADYVAGVSHDLKSPLTSMLGFATTLRRYSDDLPAEDRARYLEAIERQARRLVTMSEDLVLAGRMEQGHVVPGRSDRMSPAELLLEAVETLDPERRGRIHLVDVAAGGTLTGDRAQLLRVLTNLLDNALKYGGEREPIEVTVRTDATTAAIEVRDHGPGVAPEDRDAIFERYRRGTEGQLRGSTGLGLYISRGIARGHGGELTVAPPTTGPGAVFRLTLPVEHRGAPAQ